uniref:Uncharacterized protein n=1 Tax=Cacopsylla melanoneura TaxID=428564 RepID=A0A8D8W0L2_9HEMI
MQCSSFIGLVFYWQTSFSKHEINFKDQQIFGSQDYSSEAAAITSVPYSYWLFRKTIAVIPLAQKLTLYKISYTPSIYLYFHGYIHPRVCLFATIMNCQDSTENN